VGTKIKTPGPFTSTGHPSSAGGTSLMPVPPSRAPLWCRNYRRGGEASIALAVPQAFRISCADRVFRVASQGLAMLGTRTFLALLATGLLATSGTTQARESEITWAAVWQASPEPARSPTVTLNNQTVREVVRISLGGSKLRVRLTNEFGDAPLHIGSAHVALAGEGSSIKLGSDHALTFGGGAHEVIIPEHAYVLSDPVDLSVPSLGQLAVSIYVPGNERTLTEHFFALQNAYVAPRDVTSSTTLPATTTITKRLLLSGIDVAVTHRTKVVVGLGDSTTSGFGSTPGTDRRWTDRLAEKLVSKKSAVSVVNAGIGGNRLLHDFIGPNGLSRFDRDVLNQSGITHVIVLIGINDFGLPGGRKLPQEEVSLEQMVAGFRQLIARAHGRGVKIIAATLLPFGPIPERPGYYSDASAAKREALNQWIRSSHEFDGVIDFDAALHDPKDPKSLLPSYDSGDHLNPNDDGYKAMADAVDLKLID
jgi:lysophospholipase L1-like esterase